jgi:exonuclease SbcC
MKILRIRVSNLNSLKGDHLVDLTAEPLASAGLFAITGPTGAGKSTLLDAITLALYGKAARYGNESNPEHVMSRHCGQCSAEVEFEVPSGVYRAVWERRRAREKPDGTLQQPKRYIYDAAGLPLAQQIREAESMIESLVGLNYERFLRSALLAQGEFAKFLKANANERAELLESLTGTEVYSRLGRLAHVEANLREEKLKDKEAVLDQITVLEDDVRNELETLIKSGDERREELNNEIKAGTEMLGKITGLEKARIKEKDATDEVTKIENERNAAATDLERLRLHRLTLPFEGDLARLDAAESTMKSALKNREEAEAEHAKAKTAQVMANHILRTSLEAAITARQREAKEAGQAAVKETKIAVEARKWLDENKGDAGLLDQMVDLAAAIGELKNARKSGSDAWTEWMRSASNLLPDLAAALPETLAASTDTELDGMLDEFLGKAGERLEALEVEGEQAKKQFDLRKDHLDKAKLVAKLEDHRHDLKRGEPCPLCGALEHPYAEGAIPGAEIAELQAEVNKANEKLEETRDTFRVFGRTLTTLSADKAKIIDGMRGTETRREELETKLQPLAVKTPSHGAEDELRKALQERERDYRKHLKEEEDATKRKAEAESKASKAAGEAEDLEKKIGKLSPLPGDLAMEAIAHGDVPGVSEAEEAYGVAVSRENITAAKVNDRKKDEKEAEEALTKKRQPLEFSVAGTEFQTLENLRTARLTSEDAKGLEELDSQLKNRVAAAEALLKQAREDIRKLLIEKVLEGEDAESFKVCHGKLKEEWDKLLEEQVNRRGQIKTDDGNRKLRKDKEKELIEDLHALTVWRKLRELIGSHDGSKFRRYAQTISLDILTRHANRHLEKLSDRYRICRDEQEALNLQIEDLHQAGVKRPMASLSGGESFLVSLALALGLSDLAGRTVRIDSLFIDEGFGSLDPDTLEVAIAALESLRQNHKKVGVISHVGLLKERIGTQIVVEKQAGGVSRIRVVA